MDVRQYGAKADPEPVVTIRNCKIQIQPDEDGNYTGGILMELEPNVKIENCYIEWWQPWWVRLLHRLGIQGTFGRTFEPAIRIGDLKRD